MRFLCDEMLKRLGQWLRAAGYDVLILPDGSDDRSLLQRADNERRILLTRDRELAQARNHGVRSVLLECSGLEDCVADLQRQLPVDWLYRPFTRCMSCNTVLTEAPAGRLHEVPRAVASGEATRYCPRCDQLFWDGSHVARMRERLQRWHSTQPEARPG